MNSVQYSPKQPAASEDDSYFENLIRQHGSRMLVVAKRYLRSDADAQDCVQDAFIQAFRNLEKFEGRSSVETWLQKIVINTALMKLRSTSRSREDLVEDNPSLFDSNGIRRETESEVSLSVEDFAVRKESQEMVKDAIDELPENFRNLLMLRDIEGYSVIETAELLEMSQGSVKTGLHRARNALKFILEKKITELS